MSDSSKQWILLISVVAFVILLDQVAEWLTVTNLALGQTWEPVSALSGFIKVMRSHNTGAAFGMFPAGSSIFLVLAVITTLLFVVMYPQMPEGAWLSRLSIALVIGGALSNAIDRVQYGYVVDYFFVKLWGNYSNISNFADHAITLGVIFLLIDQWRLEQRAKHSPDPSSAVDQAPSAELSGEQNDMLSDRVPPPPSDTLAGSSEADAIPNQASPWEDNADSDLPYTSSGDLSADPPAS